MQSSTAAGTLYLIAIQVFSRGLTFVGNQALLRFVQPGHLGVAVQLETLSTSVLYTSRESLRVALQRTPLSDASVEKLQTRKLQSQLAVNAAWLAVLLGIILDVLLTRSFLASTSHELLNAVDFGPAFRLYNIATVLELISEPCFVIIQQHAQFKSRARAETSAAIARCVTSCLTAMVIHKVRAPLSVLPFAVGQLFYGLTLFSIYVWSAWRLTGLEDFSMFPARVETSRDTILGRFSRPLLALAGAFYGQSIFKWVLTQGDTLVLSIFASLRSQGIFALASNYGGLASRLLFQPVEESSRNVFGLLLSTSAKSMIVSPKGPRLSPEIVQKREQALSHLSRILRAYLIIVAVPCCTLLPRVFPLLIRVLLGSGSQWTSPQTVHLLAVYSYYIPFLAVNGILDAFVSVVATEAELGAQSLMMVGVTMMYLSAAYFGMTVMQLGAVGLVYANILNMSLRIAFSFWFLRAWMEENLPEARSKAKPSNFRAFMNSVSPSCTCSLMVAPVIIIMQAQSSVKDYFARYSLADSLITIKVDRLGVDAFDLNYLATATVLVASAVVVGEGSFLSEFLVPLLPVRVRNKLYQYLPGKNGAGNTAERAIGQESSGR